MASSLRADIISEVSSSTGVCTVSTSMFGESRFDFTFTVDDEDWALMYYALPHNGYRNELKDMYQALKGLSRLGPRVTRKHLHDFSKWLHNFGEIFAEHNEFEDIHITPKLMRKADASDRKLLKEVEEEHDVMMLKLSKVRAYADPSNQYATGKNGYIDDDSPSRTAARIIKSGAAFIESALACMRREELREAVIMKKYFNQSLVSELDGEKIEFFMARSGFKGAKKAGGIMMSWVPSHEHEQIKDRYIRKFTHRVVYNTQSKPWYEKHRALLRDLFLFGEMREKPGERYLASEWLEQSPCETPH
mmetsp:Transcript_4024/g.8872  ORF Transcript_4024/g.8872 Transcript_4024/m.8872 type:complete len:305 (-) Transcript_4024:69-983(-)